MNTLVPEIAVTDEIIRSLAVFGFLLLGTRVAGERLLGQPTAFDLVVLLIISNVLQDAAIGNDNALGGGLLGATVILALNCLVAWLTFRHKHLGRLVANTPTVIGKHGPVILENLVTEHVSMAEARYAIPEEDGHVNLIPRRPVPA